MIACVMVDGGQRYEIKYRTPAWHASIEWAKFHGLDPNGIPAESEVVRDAENCRILYSAFLKDGPGVANIVIRDLEPVTIDCVEQGEAPPLPFPREVTG